MMDHRFTCPWNESVVLEKIEIVGDLKLDRSMERLDVGKIII